jgi:hypothetical protein
MISPLPGSPSLGRVLIRQGGSKHSPTSRFAIAITLIILEIAVLAGSTEDLVAAIPALWPSYLACLLSFASRVPSRMTDRGDSDVPARIPAAQWQLRATSSPGFGSSDGE